MQRNKKEMKIKIRSLPQKKKKILEKKCYKNRRLSLKCSPNNCKSRDKNGLESMFVEGDGEKHVTVILH